MLNARETMAKFTTCISDNFAKGALHTIIIFIIVMNAYQKQTRIVLFLVYKTQYCSKMTDKLNEL